MSHLLAGLIGLGVALLPAPAANPEPPAPLTAWVETDGPAAVLATEVPLPDERFGDVAVGQLTPVHAWSTEFKDGEADAEPLVLTDRWVAPVVVDGTGVGALVTTVDNAGEVVSHSVLWDHELGSSLAKIQGAAFIVDAQTGAWFRLGGEILTPVNAEARDVLAGSIDVHIYQAFLQERPEEGNQYVPENPQLAPVWITGATLAVVLFMAGILVWARRPEGNDD